MLTKDLQEVDWPTATVAIASFVTADDLKALQSKELHTRCMAHAHFEMIHLHRLFGANKSAFNSALVRLAIGRRMVQADVAEYCEGYTNERKLYYVLGKFPSRKFNKTWKREDLIKALLKAG